MKKKYVLGCYVGWMNRREKKEKLECGPMPNMMAALPNIGCTLCLTPQSFADAQYWSAMQ